MRLATKGISRSALTLATKGIIYVARIGELPVIVFFRAAVGDFKNLSLVTIYQSLSESFDGPVTITILGNHNTLIAVLTDNKNEITVTDRNTINALVALNEDIKTLMIKGGYSRLIDYKTISELRAKVGNTLDSDSSTFTTSVGDI